MGKCQRVSVGIFPSFQLGQVRRRHTFRYRDTVAIGGRVLRAREAQASRGSQGRLRPWDEDTLGSGFLLRWRREYGASADNEVPRAVRHQAVVAGTQVDGREDTVNHRPYRYHAGLKDPQRGLQVLDEPKPEILLAARLIPTAQRISRMSAVPRKEGIRFPGSAGMKHGNFRRSRRLLFLP